MLSALKTLVAICVWLSLAGMISRMVGGRRALRNPWVYGALGCAALGGLALAGAGFLVRPGDHEVADWIWILGLAVFLSGLGWALGAGHRRREAVERILGGAIHERPHKAPTDRESEIMALAMGRDGLEALHALILPMGGAPGYHWLTPEWVEARLRSLPDGAGSGILPG